MPTHRPSQEAAWSQVVEAELDRAGPATLGGTGKLEVGPQLDGPEISGRGEALSSGGPQGVGPTQQRTSKHLSRRQRRRQKRNSEKEEARGRAPIRQPESPSRATDWPAAMDGTSPQQKADAVASLSASSIPKSGTTTPQVDQKDLPNSTPVCGATHHTYPGSLFVPGRVAGKSLVFLVDTGCTHNLLSKAVYDRLPASIRGQMVPQDTMAAMADGSGLPIYGRLTLEGRLRNVPFEATFLVCKISDEGILGMSFLQERGCSVACDKGLLVVEGTAIQCVDKAGRLLANKVQVLRTCTVPAGTEAQVVCRLNSEPSGRMGLVENLLEKDDGLVVAATLGRPNKERGLLVRCMNLSQAPKELKAGAVIGVYQPVEADQVEVAPPQTRCIQPGRRPAGQDCPKHVQPLLEQAARECTTEAQL